MKALALLIPLALLSSGWLLFAMAPSTTANGPQAPSATANRSAATQPAAGLCCQPYADRCPACKDCTACHWCSVKGGTCSVCLTH